MSHPPATAQPTTPRKVLLPRRKVTPLLHEALAWHGFQVEQQPISSQDVPSWLKRMHARQLAMPLCPGLVDQGWIETQKLVLHPEQPHLVEHLWLLLPQGLVGSSREARHLIRTLRQRVEKAGEARLAEGDSPGHEPLQVLGDDLITTSRENDAKTASPLVCGVLRSAVPSAADCVRTAVCRPRDASPPGMSEMLLKARSGALVQKLWACGPLPCGQDSGQQQQGGPTRA